MRRTIRTLAAGAALAAAALLSAAPAAAQDYPAAVGWGGGASIFTNLSDAGPQDLKFETGWIANVHAERWLGSGRFGVKIGGAMTQRPLDVGSAFTVGDIRTWMGDVTALVRLASPSPYRTVAPYIGAGIGVVSYQLGEGPRVSIVQAGAEYSGHDENQFAAVGTVGFDILPGIRWGIHDVQEIGFRLEGVDRVALKSPFRGINNGSDFGPVHNLQVSLSIFSSMDWVF